MEVTVANLAGFKDICVGGSKGKVYFIDFLLRYPTRGSDRQVDISGVSTSINSKRKSFWTKKYSYFVSLRVQMFIADIPVTGQNEHVYAKQPLNHNGYSLSW